MGDHKGIRRFPRLGLAPRLIGLIVAVAMTAGGVVGFGLINTSTAALREKILASNLSRAQVAGEFIADYMQSLQTSVCLFSTRPSVIEAVVAGEPHELEAELLQLTSLQTALDGASIVDAQGVLQASANSDLQAKGISYADRDWFQKAVISGKPYQGVPVSSRITGKPVAPYAVPIYDGSGTFRAVLLAEFSLNTLSNAFTKIPAAPDSRFTFLDFRNGGIILADSDPGRILTTIPWENQAVPRLINGESGALETPSTSGEMDLVAFTPLKELSWGIMIIQPSQTALAALSDLPRQAALYVLLTIVIAASLGGLLTLRFTRPLFKLRDTAGQFAAGDLSRRVRLTAQNEVGDLGRAFDQMADSLAEKEAQLRAYNQELEQMVTERTKMLAESEERFRRIFSDGPLGMVMVGRNFNFIRANQAFCRLVGYPEEELVGLSIAQVTHPEEASRDVEAIRALVNGDTPIYRTDKRYIRKDQAVVWGSLTASVMVDESGRFLYLLAMIEDISQRKLAEAARQESDRKFKELTESLPQLVWTCQPDGACDYLSRQWVEYTGIAELEQLGYGWLEQLHPDDRQDCLVAWQMNVERGGLFDQEYRIRGADGIYRWFKAWAAPLRDLNGTITRWFGSATDIDQQKRAEQEILQLNADLERRVEERTTRLEAAVKELENFSYSVSHDLRAPLRAVNGYANLIQDLYGNRLDPEADRYLGVIRENAGLMGKLVDNLLAFTRLGRQPMKLQTVWPADLVAQVLDHFQPEMEGRALEIVIGSPAGDPHQALPACRADPVLLREVFHHLLSNALKFTRHSPAARIEIGTLQESGQCIYYVKDNGVGFDMRFSGKLFGVFQRLHRVEDYEGLGVGLAFVQRIIQRHGGRLWAEAQVDHGATFFFTVQGDASNG